MIKVYKVKSKGGLVLQAAVTPFGVLLYPEHHPIQDAFKFGWKVVATSCAWPNFKEWKGKRYRVIGVKMIKGCNE